MMVADIFVILDTVQFTPRHEENRTRVKSPQGPQWLSIPIRNSSRRQLIHETRIDDSRPWRRKAIQTISAFYGKAPFYRKYAPQIMSIFESSHEELLKLNRISWEPALRLLGIDCKFVYASELPVLGRGPRLLLDICKYLGADEYLSGAFGREYLDIREFEEEDVKVRFHEYSYPVYQQRFGDFVPFLSYLDMLVNADLEKDRVVAGGRMPPSH
jgi:hypothetical protein